jgi:hypothetical protein
MNCYLSLIGSDWEENGGMSALLVSHGFHRSELLYGDSLVYTSNKTPEEVEIFVRHFLLWLGSHTSSSERRVPAWSILATHRALSSEQSPQYLPLWALVEFFNSILLEDEVIHRLARAAPDLASRFEPNENLGLSIY